MLVDNPFEVCPFEEPFSSMDMADTWGMPLLMGELLLAEPSQDMTQSKKPWMASQFCGLRIATSLNKAAATLVSPIFTCSAEA